MEKMEKLFTPKEVSEYLGRPEKTILDWLRAKKMKGIKLGKEWRIPMGFLQAFIDERKREADDTTEKEKILLKEFDCPEKHREAFIAAYRRQAYDSELKIIAACGGCGDSGGECLDEE